MGNREPVRVAHASPGRIRLKFGAEKSDIPDLDNFLAIVGVQEVSFNKLTKSLIVRHDREVPTERVLDAIEKIPYLELQGRIGPGIYTNGNGLQITRVANGLLELGGELFRQKNGKCLKFLERLFTIKEVKEVELDPASGKVWVKYSGVNEGLILEILNKDVKLSEVLRERRRQKRHKAPFFSPWIFCCQLGERIKFVRHDELATSWQIAHELPWKGAAQARDALPETCRLPVGGADVV